MARLRAVDADERVQVAKPKNLREATESSERDLLVTMRSQLAATIDAGVQPAYLAPLMRQLRDIDQDIRLLDEKAQQEADEDAANAERRAWNPQAI